MRESTVEKLFIKACQQKGALCWKFSSPGLSGVPDRIVLAPKGRVFFVELKRPGGRARRLQRYVHGLLERMGHEVLLIDDLEKVHAFAARL